MLKVITKKRYRDLLQIELSYLDFQYGAEKEIFLLKERIKELEAKIAELSTKPQP